MTGDSFAPDDSFTIVGPEGQRGHRDLVEHTERFTPKLWSVTDGVWCFVGNGLSNQTFVEGPEGVICLLYTSPSPRDGLLSRMPSSA